MKHFNDLIAACLPHIKEIFPWDLSEKIEQGEELFLLDVREPYEYNALHINGTINVPRGILETSCEYDYEETIPELVEARDKEVIVICRSGNRSVLAAYTMQLMGYRNIASLKTGVRGWNDFEQPLFDIDGKPVHIDSADDVLLSRIRDDQRRPSSRS